MKRTGKRLLSLLLTLVMALSVIPGAAFAAGETYTKVTSLEELTTGQYVMVVSNGYAPGVLDGSWLTTGQPTIDGTTITGGSLWTITVNENSAKLTDSNGVTIKPKSGNNNGIQAGDYDWAVTCSGGTFRFAGTGSDTTTLACNTQTTGSNPANYRFRAYKNSTISGNPDTYPCDFTLYKLTSGGDPVPETVATPVIAPASGTVSEQTVNVTITCATEGAAIHYTTDGTAPTAESAVYTETGLSVTVTDTVTVKAIAVKEGMTDSAVAEATYTYEIPTVPISDALAGEDGTAFTVKGVVTLVDGSNIYVQDSTGGICVRMSAKPEDISLGDTIIGTGKKATFNGLPQLGSSTYVKSSGMTLTAKGTTIGALTAADICTYVKLSGLEITEVYDNGGKYANPNITVKDADGSTIQLYKAVINKNEDGTWEYAVGDKINVTAAVGVYNETFQLRNTLASEITEVVAPTGPLADGDKVVIYNPANMKALSTAYTGFYNNATDVTLSGETLTGFTAADVWTVGVDADGNYTFSTSDGKKLSMGASYSSMPLDDVNTAWSVTDAATAGLYYIKNVGRNMYLEWFASKSSWSAYGTIGSNEALFAQAFYKVTGDIPGPASGLPAAGDQVVIYNLSAKGVLALQDDNVESPSITNAAAAIADGKVTAENGGVIFTVEKNGDYYRFKNETYGYLCSNGTGNNAFYQHEASEDADWTLAKQGTGYTMESRTAKYGGQYSQYLEYYAGAYKTYSMYKVTDYDIYTFQFYPCANTSVTGGVVNQPEAVFGTLTDAYVGQDYTLTFTVNAVFGVQTLAVSLGGEALTYTEADGVYTVVIPQEKISGESLTVTVSGTDTKGVAITGTAVIAVKDEPVISDLTPAAGSQTGDSKRPVISAVITNAGENPTITMTVNGASVSAVYENGKVSYTPASDLADGRTSVTVTVKRADGKESSKTWSFTVGTANQQLYFGQLHSHTQYSDGSGSLDSALEHIKNLPDSANVDFAAFTDHSNYFDKSGAANPEGALYDMSLATEYSQGVWSEYKSKVAAFNASQSDVVAIGGFEMTWSGGPGHINTFNTPGIVSRNNTTLNNKTDDAGMKAYYALLSQPDGVDSISQFNHPGTTFGNFKDFAYWDALIDTRMYLVEVGNGEGAIGAGGYYPSYEQYTMALDKGWHLAPTNNQDNHKGKWGNANDARDVILTDNFSEAGIYEAIRNYRVYSTEDKNLEVYYTVNDLQMGSIIAEVPEKLSINVQVNDPDASDSISKVEVIVNSGRVAYTWNDPTVLATGELTCELEPEYSYYYIRVTQGDGDIAVTAPVWVGEALKLGITSVVCGTSTPVTGEELTLTTTLFNSEAMDATIKSITYTSGDDVLGTDTTAQTVPASGTLTVDFKYTPTAAKVMTVKVTVVMEQEGKEYEFSMDITLDVLNADDLVYIGIDASHYNEYVAGNYKDSMGNFGNLAAGYSVRTVELKTSEDLIAACGNNKYKAIILTAPSRRDGVALRNPYATYSDAEIQALVAFNQAGGALVFAGWSDYYESYETFTAEDHMAAQQNKVLAALGSSLRISDDGINDDSLNGGQSQRLYFNTYGENFLTEGVEVDPDHPNDRLYTEVFSHYGGASIYVVDDSGNATATVPGTVSPLVYGHTSTYSKDSDNDGLGGSSVPKYAVSEGDERLMVMASEQLSGRGLIVVSGAAFMSNFEVQATISDNGSEKNYSNYKICENLVQYLNPVKITDIATVQAEPEEGVKFTIEGIVTSNASGYDKDTAFFDCIYVQDDTAGINAFPVAGNYKIGDKVRITGTTSSYQGERQIAVSSITLISEGNAVEPKAVTAAQITDRSVLGSLVTLKGTVVEIVEANGLPLSIYVKDAAGNVARVFIDGYISKETVIENLAVGCSIEATGLASYDNTYGNNPEEDPDHHYAEEIRHSRIRISNRANIICTAGSTPVTPPVYPVYPIYPINPNPNPSTPTAPTVTMPFVDVPGTSWYHDAVHYVWEKGIIKGVSATEFEPDAYASRAMFATVIYRINGATGGSVSNPFSDVVSGSWYADAVCWAAANGVVNGYEDGTFAPNQVVTREQIATMLYRYCISKGLNVSTRGDLSVYPDSGDIHSYARTAMEWAVGTGIIKGNGGLLDPNGRATRAELAMILMRFCETILK